MLQYETVKNWPFAPVINSYCADDCIRYALSVGVAADPLAQEQLCFVTEYELQTLPTFVATVGAPGAWASEPHTGIDWMQILHGEHRMRFFRRLPTQGRLLSQTRVLSVVDKGQGRGALVTTQRQVQLAETGELLAQIEHVSFCRADGGYSASAGASDEALPALPAAPARAADASLELPTHRNAALLYRLNGDRNPIHALPSAWQKAGFDQPILHGLCTYGTAAQGLVRLACAGDAGRLGSIAVRFSAPVHPGETLVLHLWRGVATENSQTMHFEMFVQERACKVLSHGVAEVLHTALPEVGSQQGVHDAEH